VTKLTTEQWIYMLTAIIIVDAIVFMGVVYYFAVITPTPQTTSAVTVTYTPVPTLTPTQWAGPPPTVTPTPTWPPTPVATTMFSGGEFNSEFVPTPRPPVLDEFSVNFDGFASTIQFLGKQAGKIPVINQLLYPEPFFPAGSNNACGPVALFATFTGLGANIHYQQLRDIAVRNDFASYGITVSGLVNTAYLLNSQIGQPFSIEQSRNYTLSNLSRLLRQGKVLIVLVRVKRVNGNYQVTTDKHGSIGHFLVVERINMATRRVQIAGSTLGMKNVPLDDFISSWTSSPPEPKPERPIVSLNSFNSLNILTIKPIEMKEKKQAPTGWAMAIRRK